MPPRNNAAGATGGSILIPEDAGDADQPIRAGASANNGPIGMPETVRIILEENEDIPPTGQTFSLNGRAYLIRPGEEVRVPRGLIEILDNAIIQVPVRGAGMRVTGYRPRLRFPYRRLGQAA
jgi:hypothetical protein